MKRHPTSKSEKMLCNPVQRDRICRLGDILNALATRRWPKTLSIESILPYLSTNEIQLVRDVFEDSA